MLVSVTGSQIGCGCECATVATLATAAAPVVVAVREVKEARKTEADIERLEAERRAQLNPEYRTITFIEGGVTDAVNLFVTCLW